MIGSLALATVRARRGSFVAAFVALLSAAALITACGALLETGLLGTVPVERYAGSPVVVAERQSLPVVKSNGKVKAKPLTEHAWVDGSVLDRLRRDPGTHDAVGEVTFTASVIGPGGGALGASSWGHAWSSAVLTPFTLAAGHAPRGATDVVVDARLARQAELQVGSRAAVLTAAGRARYTVVGITARALPDEAGLFFADATARRLAGHPGRYFAIGFARPNAPDPADLHKALAGTGARAVRGSDRALVEFTDVARTKATLISMSGVLGGTSILVVILVVTATFALSIAQRQRELALLRAIAATPRQIRRMIGGEAALLGLLAALPGCAAGLVVAGWLRARFVAFHVMPPDMRLHVSPVPVAVGLVVTVLAGWLAARVSARRTTRIRPSQALREAAVEPRAPSRVRSAAGLVALAGYFVLLGVLTRLHTDAAASPVTLVCALLAAVAVALLGPVIARLSSAVLGAPMRLVGRRVGHVAAANNRSNGRRLASVLTPITLATTLSATILFTPTTAQHVAAAQRSAGIRADAVIVPSGRGIPRDVVAAAGAAPGVGAATAELHRSVRIGQDKYPATAATPAGLDRTLDLGVIRGSVARLTTHDVALSTGAARHRRVAVGDKLTLTLGDGTRSVMRLAAIYTRGLGFGDVLLPVGLLGAHVDQPMADDVLVTGVAPARLATELRGLTGFRVLDADGFRSTLATAQQGTAEIGYLELSLVLAFAAIAILNTLAMAMSARLREFAALRLVGMKRRQIRTMVALETGAVTGTALVLGAGFAAGVLWAYAHGMTPGYRPDAPPMMCLAIVAGTVLLVAVGLGLSVPGALRARPADTINDLG